MSDDASSTCSVFSDDGIPDPVCPADLKPGALLVRYKLDSGPPLLSDDQPDVLDRLDRMGDAPFVWLHDANLTYVMYPKTPFYRERLLKPFLQKIGQRSFYRCCIDAEAFFDDLSKENQDIESHAAAPLEEQPDLASCQPGSSSESHMQPEPPTSSPMPEPEPPSNPTQQPKRDSADQTGQLAQPNHHAKFRPRRHPSTFQTKNLPPNELVTCLLFRPLAGNSLQAAEKKLIALSLLKLKPPPVAVRRIRDGGLAVDFPADQPTSHIQRRTKLGGIPVKVEPPRKRLGSSGVIRGDFAAAEEVRDLYDIHDENPSIANITQLGEQPVFKIDFCGPRPETIRLFHNTVQVEPFFNKPVRCFQCSGFGHKAGACKRQPSCSLCASLAHTYATCPRSKTRCINCGGPHPATSKTCPHHLFLLSAAKTAATRGISLNDARREAANSYADAVKQAPKRKTPKENNTTAQPTTRHQPVQRPKIQTAGRIQPENRPPKPLQPDARAPDNALIPDIAQLLQSLIGLLFPGQTVPLQNLQAAITSMTGLQTATL